jgi:multiple sugar transport system substrate-binding protein
MRIRKWLYLVVIAGMLLFPAACAAPPPAGAPAADTAAGTAAEAPADTADAAAAPAAEPVEVTLGFSGGVWIEKYFEEVLAGVQQDLPGVTVKTVIYPTYDDLVNTLPSQVAAGTNPDVLYWTNEQLAEYANNGVLAPLDDMVEPAGINLDDYYGALVEGWRVGGKLYGVPFNGQNSALVVNNDLLAAAGLSGAPKSMQELREGALAIKEKTGSTGIVLQDNLFHISQYIYAFGGGWGNGKTINSPENVAAIQFLVDLFTKDQTMATQKQLGASWDGEAFAKGNVGFSTGGPWYIGYMAESGPDVDYSLTPLPTDDGGTVMVTYGGALSVFDNVENKDAAMQVIAYLLRDDHAELMVTGGLKYLPAKTKYMDLYIEQVPEFAPLKDAFAGGIALDYPAQSKEFGDELVQGFQQLAFQPGGMTVQALLDDLQAKYGTE